MHFGMPPEVGGRVPNEQREVLPACMPTNTSAANLLAHCLQCDVLLVAGAATGPPLALGLVLASLVVLAILDGCCQPAVFGDAATLPPQYTHAVVGGTASAGVVISFLRIITKAALPATPAGLRVSTAIYFALSAAICGGCVVVYGWLLPKLEVVAYWRAKRAGSAAGACDVCRAGGWQDTLESSGGDREPKGMGISSGLTQLHEGAQAVTAADTRHVWVT